MASAGQRYVETVDAIANAAYTEYQLGQLIVDLATEKVYVRGASAWVLIGAQTV